MNPIAAHKDEFKQLLEKLSSRRCRLRDNFRDVTGCLFSSPRYELFRHQGARQSAASAKKMEN